MSALLNANLNQWLAGQGLELPQLEQLLAGMMTPGIDFGELFFESESQESWSLEDGLVKDGSYSIDQGCGIRALSGEKTGLAYSSDLSLDALRQAARAVRGICRQGQQGSSLAVQPVLPTRLYPNQDPLASLSSEQKVELLKKADQLARAADPRVTEVMVSLSGSYRRILVLASDGTLAADVQPLVRFNVSVLVEQQNRRERGSSGGGLRGDYSFLFEGAIERHVEQAVRMALVNLDAVEAPAGVMPVVLGAGWPGVLLHEAIGHGLEGDFNRKGSSAFSGRIGQKVASEHCTVVDDGTLLNRRGSISIDDEGTPSQQTLLIENGILRGYLQDKLNARLMGMTPTGNGRRESYMQQPLPRMTNTYMLAGDKDPAEIIASVKRGLYASNFGGGQVDITSGRFVFSASEAYLIENGRITRPVKGATLIGNGPDVLNRVSMVGSDLRLDEGVGVCGKEGQSVPVGVGQPTLLLDELTVGGTA